MCSSMLIPKFVVYSKQQSTHSAHKRSDKSSSGHLQEVKNNGKSLNCKPQIVVAVAYRRWSFTRDSNCKALTGTILVFWRGGRTWRFDCIWPGQMSVPFPPPGLNNRGSRKPNSTLS